MQYGIYCTAGTIELSMHDAATHLLLLAYQLWKYLLKHNFAYSFCVGNPVFSTCTSILPNIVTTKFSELYILCTLHLLVYRMGDGYTVPGLMTPCVGFSYHFWMSYSSHSSSYRLHIHVLALGFEITFAKLAT